MPDRQAILIIEDDDAWRTVLQETLEDEGYDVIAVASYRGGRQALESHSFDLILLDLELDKSAPMLEGERLLRLLSQHHANTPCVIVSGQGDVHIVRNAFKKYRVVDFVAKDKRFDIFTFVQTVRDALEREYPLAEGVAPAVAPHRSPDVSVQAAAGAVASRRRRLTRLLQLLTERFDESELRTICFHLSVDYEDLPGVGKTNKARELIRYLDRRDRVQEFVDVGKELRPDVQWAD